MSVFRCSWINWLRKWGCYFMQRLYLWRYGTSKASDGDICNHAKYNMQKQIKTNRRYIYPWYTWIRKKYFFHSLKTLGYEFKTPLSKFFVEKVKSLHSHAVPDPPDPPSSMGKRRYFYGGLDFFGFDLPR